jgi:putative hemolysin
MLSREVLRQRGSVLKARIGHPIPAERLASFTDDGDLASYLRVRTYLLGRRSPAVNQFPASRREAMDEVSPTSIDPKLLAEEASRLPAEQCLARSGTFSVYISSAAEVPHTLEEIGRLREITFRGVGEGTGRASDLDRFDRDYLHLFVRDELANRVVGAYRLGLTDQLLATHGKAGLYTHTLFEYRKTLLSELGSTIELGHSFIRAEYQRAFAPLMLLWRGIATFVSQNPKYRHLFGPVSISADYNSATRQLLMAFLDCNRAEPNLARYVQPRNPPTRGRSRRFYYRLVSTVVRTVEAVDELVADIEHAHTGMPVLLRQYLKLNARLLGFNVDPDFGNVVDGLMLSTSPASITPASPATWAARKQRNSANFTAWCRACRGESSVNLIMSERRDGGSAPSMGNSACLIKQLQSHDPLDRQWPSPARSLMQAVRRITL